MIDIRVLGPADVAEWRRVRLEALASSPRAFSSSYEETVDVPLDTLVARFGVAESPIFGAFDGDTLVGTVGLMRQRGLKERHKGLIWGMYVDPSQRGGGVGQRLMETAIAFGRGFDGLRQIHLGVAPDNVAARALYERMGFVRYGTEPRALVVDGQDVDEDHMALLLDA